MIEPHQLPGRKIQGKQTPWQEKSFWLSNASQVLSMSPECAAESSIVLRHVGLEMLGERHQVFSDAGDVLSRGEAEVGERSAVHRSFSCCLGAPEFESRHKFQLV